MMIIATSGFLLQSKFEGLCTEVTVKRSVQVRNFGETITVCFQLEVSSCRIMHGGDGERECKGQELW